MPAGHRYFDCFTSKSGDPCVKLPAAHWNYLLSLDMCRTTIRTIHLLELYGRRYTLSSLQPNRLSLHTSIVTGNKPVVTRRYT